EQLFVVRGLKQVLIGALWRTATHRLLHHWAQWSTRRRGRRAAPLRNQCAKQLAAAGQPLARRAVSAIEPGTDQLTHRTGGVREMERNSVVGGAGEEESRSIG